MVLIVDMAVPLVLFIAFSLRAAYHVLLFMFIFVLLIIFLSVLLIIFVCASFPSSFCLSVFSSL